MNQSIISTFLLFVLIAPIFGQMFYPKHKMTKKYFIITLKTVTWHEAFYHCRSIDMNLVSISSKAENDQIKQQIIDEGHIEFGQFWTSGTKLPDNSYKWLGIGKRVGFSDWFSGKPDNFNENDVNCIQILEKGKGWNNAPCNLKQHIICEQELIEYEYCNH
ncbi:perlucin-like [Contarinia nasturtii]|uniref:perlucin-like n=1 Tax=Contarinia nasturtii TaxID=265458 RepID=UPI0012D3B953|nr:perlucin-like [Contarinia nasturtii]